VLIRRNDTTGELAYHRCWSPTPVPLAALVTVAGQRWRIEESFQAPKGLVGLDQHQVRRWVSWQRPTVLAMLAHAFLAVATAAERDHHPDAGRPDRGHRRGGPAPRRRPPAPPPTHP
jgi:SRSO17 transposase